MGAVFCGLRPFALCADNCARVCGNESICIYLPTEGGLLFFCRRLVAPFISDTHEKV